MRYFKKFGDFCSGFAAFAILIYLFRQFMTFEPSVKADEALQNPADIGALEKLKYFLARDVQLENYFLCLLAMSLIVSVIAGVIFKKLPYIAVLFTVCPMLLTVYMLGKSYIDEYPELILILTSISFIACLYECIRRDREDGGCRIGIAGDMLCVAISAFFMMLKSKAEKFAALGEDFDTLGLGLFDKEIHDAVKGASDFDGSLLLAFAVIYLSLVVVRVCLRDIYFIDFLLTLPAFCMLVYYWNTGALIPHADMVITFSTCVLCARLAAAFGGFSGRKKYRAN